MSKSTHEQQYRHWREKKDYVLKCKSVPCKVCGIQYAPWVMDFDHRDRSTKFLMVSKLLTNNYSLTTLKKEIEKCDVLCANCHRDKTYKENIASGFYRESRCIPKG